MVERVKNWFLTLIILRHILTWYSLFFYKKTFLFFSGVTCVTGVGGAWETGRYTPSTPRTPCHTLFDGEGYLSLSVLSLFSLYRFLSTLTNLSSYIISMVYLFVVLSLFSFSTSPLLCPRDGVWTWREMLLWKGGEGEVMRITELLSLVGGAVQCPKPILYSFYHFSSSFFTVLISLFLTLLYLSHSPLYLSIDRVFHKRKMVQWKRVWKGNENYWIIELRHGDRYKLWAQLPIPHTYLPRGRKKKGRQQSGQWRDTANKPLTDSQIAYLPKAITYMLLVINTCIFFLS